VLPVAGKAMTRLHVIPSAATRSVIPRSAATSGYPRKRVLLFFGGRKSRSLAALGMTSRLAALGMTSRLAALGMTSGLAALGMTIAALVGLTLPSALAAQVAPNKRYYTIHTAHFYIHFTTATEPTARRVAVDAERAYAELASELHPPRGSIDVVISDDADYSNGSATPFPTNRIVVYANPPVQSPSLRFTDDWGAMVITHELTHIFHLDRSRGLWRVAQYVFGRSPYFFPNEYDPSWLTEGLAVCYESRFTGAGRIDGCEHRMVARASPIH